jgi:hypothetical protein
MKKLRARPAPRRPQPAHRLHLVGDEAPQFTETTKRRGCGLSPSRAKNGSPVCDEPAQSCPSRQWLRVAGAPVRAPGQRSSARRQRHTFPGMALKHRLADVSYGLLDHARHNSAFESAARPGTASDFAGLHGHRYALLITFRRDGTAVPTPVWSPGSMTTISSFTPRSARPRSAASGATRERVCFLATRAANHSVPCSSSPEAGVRTLGRSRCGLQCPGYRRAMRSTSSARRRRTCRQP